MTSGQMSEHTIQWIMVFPVDSTVQALSNSGQMIKLSHQYNITNFFLSPFTVMTVAHIHHSIANKAVHICWFIMNK